jgi:hypothetical protein
MNLTDEQKKYLVPASIGAAVFVLCDELLFKSSQGGRPGKPNQKTLLASGAGTLAGYFLYDKADAATKADYDKYALPTGGAATAYVAVNRFAPLLGKGKQAATQQKYAALGAAAVAAWFVNKPPSTPTVGMLPQRTFEPPYPPPFGPTFEPEFEG